MKLPDDMLTEIERLGEATRSIEWIAQEEGLDFARFFLKGLTEASQLFDKWFPKLLDFSQAKRAGTPFPRDDQFTGNDVMARRILEPKIAPAERVPQRGNFCAAFFTAPLAVLPLVMDEWPSEYRNAVFLTPDELREWNSQYDEPEDARWWYCFQNWDIDFDPPSDSFWLEHSEYEIPANAKSAIATWGLSWGSLAGGVKAELWCIEDGTEQLMGLLGDATF